MDRLHFLSGPLQGTVIELAGQQITVGRSPGSTIRIDDESISEHHATILRHGQDCVVQDTGSANGTFVRGEKIIAVMLEDGDRIVFGSVEAQFETLTRKAACPPPNVSNKSPTGISKLVFVGVLLLVIAAGYGIYTKFIRTRLESRPALDAIEYPAFLETLKKHYDLSVAREWKGPKFGMRLSTVMPGSPGEQLGLRVGDIAYAMDGVPIRSQYTWTAIRNGKECELSVYRPSDKSLKQYHTGTGLLGICFDDHWFPEAEYVRQTGMKRNFDWDVIAGCYAFRKRSLGQMQQAVNRIPKENQEHPIPELRKILEWHFNSQSVSKDNCKTLLKGYSQEEVTPLLDALMERMAANALYKELLELSHDYPGSSLAYSDYPLEHLGGFVGTEDDVISARLDEILKMNWRKAGPLVSLYGPHQDWLDSISQGKPFQWSIPSGYYEVFSLKNTGHHVWVRIGFKYETADTNTTGFANAVKIGYAVSGEEPDRTPRIHATMETSGIIQLHMKEKCLTTIRGGYKANNKGTVIADYLIWKDKWFLLVNGKEIGRGPILDPVRKECLYWPFIHISGTKGECHLLELRTLEN